VLIPSSVLLLIPLQGFDEADQGWSRSATVTQIDIVGRQGGAVEDRGLAANYNEFHTVALQLFSDQN
jgi:hypothetical protein